MARESSTASVRPHSAASAGLSIFAVPGLPEVRKRQNLAKLIAGAARRATIDFQDSDIVVVAQKIVSKSEGQVVSLARVKPSARALKFAKGLRRDPRLIELILRESRRILRSERVLITETHHGFVCANAGIDHSNVPGANRVALLPRDPDAAARRMAVALSRLTGKRLAVIISDTFGRPWRLGLTNVAIGVAGIPALLDLRGRRDRNGKLLRATVLAVADELASAAGLLMHKSAGTPVVVIRGYRYAAGGRGNASVLAHGAAGIIRPAKEDLFR